MVALTIANLKMMTRNRQTAFWALLFPLLLVVVFGLADLEDGGPAAMVVLDQANTPGSQLLRQRLAAVQFPELQAVPGGAEAARDRLQKGDTDYILLIPPGFGTSEAARAGTPPASVTLQHRKGSPERDQLVAALIQNAVAGTALGSIPDAASPSVGLELVEGHQASYFDVLLMGLVSLGVVIHSIISIAVKISTYRNQAIFKRMLVTPLPIWKYFASEVTAHLVLSLVQAGLVMAVGVYLFGAHIHGNLVWILAIVLLGNLVFLNIGFILSAWANSPAAASGMGNAVVLPMAFFAGTFFSTASLPWALPHLAQALPLTPMLVALREVAINGAALWETWPQLATLGGWLAATALIAIRVFRFS